MKITEVTINQQCKDEETGKICTVAAIFADGRVLDTENQTHSVKSLQPLDEHPYLSVDAYGHVSLCIKTDAGILMSNIDTAEDTGYNAVYLSVKPDENAEGIDFACMRDHVPEMRNAWPFARMYGSKDIVLRVWPNGNDDSEEQKFPVTQEQIVGK